MLKLFLWSMLEVWRKERERRRRLRRAPELILRAHLMMRDQEIRTLKRQLGEARLRAEGLELDLYRARQANEELTWARLKRAGVDRLSAEDQAVDEQVQSFNHSLGLVASEGVGV